MLLDPDLSIEQRITALIQDEIDDTRIETDRDLRHMDAFKQALVHPFETTVNFSGGITQTCWTVTRTDGAYRVVFMPIAGYFSLCVESDFGPSDVGVHGAAMGCYGSV